MPYGWTLDELAHAGEEHLDPAYIAAYDRKAAVDPAPDLEMLRDFGLNVSSTLVDLGAGTGTFAITAAPFCRRVVAVDISAAMLDVAQAKARQLGLSNIEFVRAGLLSYQHSGSPADFVYSRNALHHLPDFWKVLALQRIITILRPGGVLRLRDLIFSFEPEQTVSAIEAWLSHAAQRSEDGWTREELETHIRQEYSTFSWLLESMLRHTGFTIHQAEYSPSGIFTAYVCRNTRPLAEPASAASDGHLEGHDAG
ncbi:MAG TPA: class I SAM-dependent methyltransferase [Ktedonobacterales bacterium]